MNITVKMGELRVSEGLWFVDSIDTSGLIDNRSL